MFKSLRNQLIISHILPALIIIPVLGVAMVYMLETRLLMPIIYRNLAKDATLMAEITRDQPIFWQNREAAQALVDGVSPFLSGQVSFISLSKQILAISNSSDVTPGSQIIDLPEMSQVSQGDVIQLQNGPMAETFTPVYNLSGKLIGIIRMSSQVLSISDEIFQLRYLISAVLLVGVLAGIGLGSFLAFKINRPIQNVTQSILSLADGDWQTRIQFEGGPDEMGKLAQAVNTLVDRLLSLEKARRQLLANLVHELGRPLGAIRSAITALIKGADKDSQLASDLLNGLNNETIHLQSLLDDLAGLHDLVLGSLELNRIHVNPTEWLTNQLPAWEAAANEKGLFWDANIASNLPSTFMDPDRMGQALGNLLSNAVKFTPAGGKISTKIWSEIENLCFEVVDNGPGIPEEDREKIFQPFFRGSHGRKIVQGMGLGLSITKDIVLAHGGEIRFVNMEGKGSCFFIQIPITS
jgi:two-component system sensor histidine kinase BaeS